MNEKNYNHRIGYLIEGKNSRFNFNQYGKPRHDYDSSINLATPYKIKRILRDYWEAQGYPIFVSSKFSNEKEAFEYFLKVQNINNIEKIDKKYVITKEIYEKLIEFFIDIKYFGAVFESFAHKNSFKNSLLGCVQFTYGRTVNKTVIYNDSKKIKMENYKTKYELFQYSGGFTSMYAKKSSIFRRDGDDSRIVTEKDINDFYNDMSQALQIYGHYYKPGNPNESIENIFFIDIVTDESTAIPHFMSALDIEYLVDSYEDVESVSDFYIILDHVKKILSPYKNSIIDIKFKHKGTLKFKLDEMNITMESFIEGLLKEK